MAGPATMLPPFLDALGAGVTYSLEEAVAGADVIMMLRLQLERMGQRYHLHPAGVQPATSAWPPGTWSWPKRTSSSCIPGP